MIKKFALMLTALSLILSFPTYANPLAKNKGSKPNLEVRPRQNSPVKANANTKVKVNAELQKLDDDLEKNNTIQVKREVINLGGDGVKQEFSTKGAKSKK